jgi:hypothetical protein
MQCVSCSELIDDDAYYCDMCGREVMLCPSCKLPVSGKWCTSCGAPSVGASVAHNSPEPTAQPVAPVAPVNIPAAAPTIRTGTAALPSLWLRSRTLGLNLDITDGAVLGRAGAHSAAFATFSDVSGRHCCFRYDKVMGWTVTDEGSTNGTRYNRNPLTPHAAQRLEDGMFLQIASIEFLVSISLT